MTVSTISSEICLIIEGNHPNNSIRNYNATIFFKRFSFVGLNPDPKSFLRTAIRKERLYGSSGDDGGSSASSSLYCDEEKTVGLMTAASMQSLRTASRSAGGVVVDAIVTAGISNARSAGADADCFYMFSPPTSQKSCDDNDIDNDNNRDDEGKFKEGNLSRDFTNKISTSKNNRRRSQQLLKQKQRDVPPPGTINTIVVINSPLSSEAMVEAYAIVIEAKCAACADLKVKCAKSMYGELAQGTGTDCAVLLTPRMSSAINDDFVIEYAGKHILLAEMIGQAVREATREAILSNIYHIHGGSMIRYNIYQWYRSFIGILRGARPCVPPFPMMPVPRAPMSVILFGWFMVLASYFATSFIGHSATVLIAATFWDRCLPELPLIVHPVCLAGSTISVITKKWIPERVYQSPVLGFTSGVAFLVGMLSLFVSGSWLFFYCIKLITNDIGNISCNSAYSNICDKDTIRNAVAFVSWILEVALFKTTFSLQLLCTIALQMARFLERSQLKEARSQLSWLCSRDPTHLNSEELAGGTLERLSENLSDGTVAPWFWYILFGPIGAMGYRIANTLDSRVGYRGRYEWFGKASAKFDDLINLIPARLTAMALCIAAVWVPNCSAKRGLKVAWEDCSQCSSPNAGWPMAALSGVLGVRLEKKGQYCLGKNLPGVRGPNSRDIRTGHRVAQLAGGIVFVVAVAACIIKR